MDRCVDCGHILEDHDLDYGVMVGRCFKCDCDGFKAEDDMPAEFV